MQNLDTRNANMEEIRTAMMKALREDDTDAYYQSLENLMAAKAAEITAEYQASIDALRDENDSRILAQRGRRILTSEEKAFYEKLKTASASMDPKQALGGSTLPIPTTVIEDVFEDLRTNHPLLSRINFTPLTGNAKVIVSTDGYEKAAWGALTSAIAQESAAGLAALDISLNKLTAFIYVPKDALKLSAEWLDRYVREVLLEMYANGLEYGVVYGTGKNMPIGMARQVGSGVTVVDGVYPLKDAVAVTDLGRNSIANILSIMALDDNGKTRPVNDVILLCNSQDYFGKIMKATTFQAPDGTYRRDVLPYPIDIIPTEALPANSAVIGIARRYFAGVNVANDGAIEYSDEFKFLDDARTYIVRGYGDGRAKDNNAFQLLDISGLVPAQWEVVNVDGKTKSSTATLNTLKLSGLTLSPTFASGTTSYTSTASTGGSAMIFAQPSDAGATMLIKLGTTVKSNGDELTWAAGENVVTVKVTAENGSTTKTYTVTVTAS